MRLGQIGIEGLERTSRSRVYNRFRGMEGDWYDEEEMNERMREMLGTGAFSSVRIEREPAGEGTDRRDAALRRGAGEGDLGLAPVSGPIRDSSPAPAIPTAICSAS